MKVGVTFWFQNYTDFAERVLPGDFATSPAIGDARRFAEELRLIDLVEPLGFDSAWTIEHHFGPYSMTCNPLQVMTYLAGHTTRIELGTMVVVLPWHDPIRVAEEISVLDNLLRGRKLKIGVGRGAAGREFGPMGVAYATSRERMAESLEIVRRALTSERFSFHGEFYDIPEVSIRPRPLTPDLTENMLFAWSSPETLEMAASSGLAPLFAHFTGWDMVLANAKQYGDIRAKQGWEPVPATIALTVYCSPDAAEAHETGTRHWRNASDAGVWHYDKASWPSLAHMDPDERAEMLEAGYERQVASGLFGTPEQLVEQITEIQRDANVSEFICLFSFGDLPLEKAEASMRLFAAEVLPAIQAIETPEVAATRFADVRSARGDA